MKPQRRAIFIAAALLALSLRLFLWRAPIALPLFDRVSALLAPVKTSFISNIERVLPEPHAAYLAGLLVGERSELPYNIRKAFQRTGTAHIIALSGYNVTIVANYLASIIASPWFPILGILLFILITGASSSVVRAGIMGVLVYLARHYGYDYSAKNALYAAIGLMVFFNPAILFGDVGFELSVFATAGLIFLSPKLVSRMRWIPKRFGFREAASSTLSAEIATLPLVLYYFGFFSIFSPLVNILILPTIPLTMFFGFFAGILGYASNILALFAAWPSYLLLSYQLGVIQLFAQL